MYLLPLFYRNVHPELLLDIKYEGSQIIRTHAQIANEVICKENILW